MKQLFSILLFFVGISFSNAQVVSGTELKATVSLQPPRVVDFATLNSLSIKPGLALIYNTADSGIYYRLTALGPWKKLDGSLGQTAYTDWLDSTGQRYKSILWAGSFGRIRGDDNYVYDSLNHIININQYPIIDYNEKLKVNGSVGLTGTVNLRGTNQIYFYGQSGTSQISYDGNQKAMAFGGFANTTNKNTNDAINYFGFYDSMELRNSFFAYDAAGFQYNSSRKPVRFSVLTAAKMHESTENRGWIGLNQPGVTANSYAGLFCFNYTDKHFWGHDETQWKRLSYAGEGGGAGVALTGLLDNGTGDIAEIGTASTNIEQDYGNHYYTRYFGNSGVVTERKGIYQFAHGDGILNKAAQLNVVARATADGGRYVEMFTYGSASEAPLNMASVGVYEGLHDTLKSDVRIFSRDTIYFSNIQNGADSIYRATTTNINNNYPLVVDKTTGAATRYTAGFLTQPISSTPTSTGDTRGNAGDILFDNSFMYIKTSAGWKRSALSSF